MLNISENSILQKFDSSKVVSIHRNELPKANRMFSIWLIALLIIVVVIFFLPWTQNIQMKGKVTTLLPEQRLQDVNSIIAGRIEKWFVKEGDLVMAGDTIAFLSEVKAEYFDPQLLSRTASQITAKQNKVGSYQRKANALDNQIRAIQQELIFKKNNYKIRYNRSSSNNKANLQQ